ncbi:hypothetical protein ACQKMZ_25870 [Bacillus paramycoides]|uniref:hypothetical protein n=1 Tax=Bacillus paramycoides TaxID=2026194 RepID=UPI003D02B228
MAKDKENRIGAAIELIITAAGGALGATGGLVGGAIGAAFSKVGVDITKRMLSSRQEQRILNVLDYCKEKFDERSNAGDKVREDGFFELQEDEWAGSAQILEGVLIKVRDEHEEKKNKYIGYISVNVCFDEKVSMEQANYFIKLASQLTYYQFCIIALVGKNKDNKFDLRKVNYENASGSDLITTLQIIKELVSLGLINQYEDEQNKDNDGDSSIITNLEEVIPAYTSLSDLGNLFFELTSLEEMDESELQKIKSMLK